MATVQDQITTLVELQNTLTLINSMLDRISTSSISLIGGCGSYDTTRINTIREFLELQKADLEAEIACIYALNVSGSCD